MVLVGREIGNRLNYSAYSLKGEEDFRKKKATVHEISNNIHIGNALAKLSNHFFVNCCK